MISFISQNKFKLPFPERIEKWIEAIVQKEGKVLGEMGYVFCDDEFLHKMNVDYLDHDTLTDVISFDYSSGDLVAGEIYISTERVTENAGVFGVSFEEELERVMIHGVLHFCGYKDKTYEEQLIMTTKEGESLDLRFW